MVLLANLSTSIPASIASTMSSSAVTIEAGNTRNSATTDDATWLALSVKASATHISPEAHVPMSTFVRMKIGLGKPVRAGINSTTSSVPTTTASYMSVSVDDVRVTGTAYSGSTRAKAKNTTIKDVIVRGRRHSMRENKE